MSTNYNRRGQGGLFIEHYTMGGKRIPKSANWVGQFYVDGRQIRRSTRTSDKAKAEAILQSWMQNKEAETEPIRVRIPNAVIYFIRARGTDLVKIGVSGDLPKRLAQLQSKSQYKLYIAATIPVDYANQPLESYFSRNYEQWVERSYHARFKAVRIHKEVFRLNRELRDLIAANRFPKESSTESHHPSHQSPRKRYKTP